MDKSTTRYQHNSPHHDSAQSVAQSPATRTHLAPKQLSKLLAQGALGLGLLIAQLPLMVYVPKQVLADHGICGSPGIDGVTNLTTVINTFFTGGAPGDIASSGQNSLTLPAANSDGANIPIREGDMLMVIQMQDAVIDPSNNASYGSGNAANDGSGATSIGNSGIYEFVRAANDVPLAGGFLSFIGSGPGGGLQNTYVNAPATASQGRRTFQIVRVPQFATLTLGANLEVPDWNGTSGGVLAIDVAGSINFNGFTIDGTAKGFRGGYTPSGPSGINVPDYVVPADPDINEAGGKGEGIAGTPRYTWDGVSPIDLGSDQLPGGDAGRGAPGNAGGGGNDHNSGGGGGANGGFGGLGGIGWEGAGFEAPANNTTNTPGGRGGAVPIAPTIDRLIMGGGGGGGDANNEQNGVRGGQGGGIVMIRAGEFIGNGTIRANGSDGEIGEDDGAPDGAGGGGAGGTVALIAETGNLAGITVEATGGDGGNTVNDGGSPHTPHGPGGAGGGGVVISYSPGGQVGNAIVSGGTPGRVNNGAGITHGTTGGDGGVIQLANPNNVPPILSGSDCFPTLEVTKVEANPGDSGSREAPNTAEYSITVTNTNHGGASQVKIKDTLPTGFTYDSGATASLDGGASGPANPVNTGTGSDLEFGDYLIPEGGSVTVTFKANISESTPVGIYQNPAYATYLDPSRNTPGRTISPATGARAGDNTTYEGGIVAGQSVPGTNYQSSSSNGEDVHIRACPDARADLWFANDESGSVSNSEFIDSLDFIYQVSDQFAYGETTGMKAGIMGWAANPPTSSNHIIIPITDTFGDPDDTGLISDGSIDVSDADTLGVREQYTSKVVSSSGTRLDRATNYLASIITTANGRRPNTPQVAIILTDASSAQITDEDQGGGNNWTLAASILKNSAIGPGASIVLIVIDQAATAYNNDAAAQTVIDNVVGTDGQLLVVPTYSDAADATKGYIESVAQAVCDSTPPVATDPQLLLTKRITAINPGQPDGVNFTDFVDDSSGADNHPSWPNSFGDAGDFTNTYTIGATDGGQVLPNDILEYTIYFLSSGDDTAGNVLVCDRIPANTELVTNDFDTVPAAAGGTLGLDRGLAWEYNGNFESLTNGQDGDAGYYFPPGIEPSTVFPNVQCSNSNLPNDNGAIVVDLGNVPNATASGTPNDSYGFLRFRVRVK